LNVSEGKLAGISVVPFWIFFKLRIEMDAKRLYSLNVFLTSFIEWRSAGFNCFGVANKDNDPEKGAIHEKDR